MHSETNSEANYETSSETNYKTSSETTKPVPKLTIELALILTAVKAYKP